MKRLNNTTFHEERGDQLETVVGDEKQQEFYPRVKFKKWDNEANFSIGIKGGISNSLATQDGDKISWSRQGTQASFYPIQKKPKKQAKKLRWIDATLTPEQCAAEYDLFQDLEELTVVTYRPTEPAVMFFDQLPAGRYSEVNGTTVKYQSDTTGNPLAQDVRGVRIYSPYTIQANPYYFDPGLVQVFIHHKGFNEPELTAIWCQTVMNVLAENGIMTYKKPMSDKLYFEHNGEEVKFHSAENERGVHACYINLDCEYNRAYDYYKPEVEKDIRNKHAYGLKRAFDVPDNIIEEILTEFATALRVKLEKSDFTPRERERLDRLAEQQHEDWVKNGKREDANWYYHEEDDGFEFDVTFDTKPDSNLYEFSLQSKNVVLTKQEPLTAEEIEQGYHRPPYIVGGYVAYHPDKKNNQYGSGKAFEIHRPILIDADGWRQFADIDITGDTATVTMPQDFLDNANYPMTLDPTIGYTTAGASSSFLEAYSTEVEGIAGTVQSVSAYGRRYANGGAGGYRFGVLSGAGLTPRLHSQSDEGTLVTDGGQSWITENMNTNYDLIPEQTYQVSVFTETLGGGYVQSRFDLAYDTVSSVKSYARSYGTYYEDSGDQYPDPMVFDQSSTVIRWSIYLTYTANSYTGATEASSGSHTGATEASSGSHTGATEASSGSHTGATEASSGSHSSATESSSGSYTPDK